MRDYYVYIMSNHSHTLYTGFTSNLVAHVWKHKHKVYDGFTKKYNITKLLYYETTTDVRVAIEREKQIKDWRRSKKAALITRMNPTWRDLSSDFDEEALDSSLWQAASASQVPALGGQPSRREDRLGMTEPTALSRRPATFPGS